MRSSLLAPTLASFRRARLLLGRGDTLGTLFERLAPLYGPRRLVEEASGIALAGGRTTLSFQEAAELVDRAADFLRPRCAGRKPLVVHGENSYGFFLACLAVSRAGGIVVPVNPHMPAEEVAWISAHAGGQVLELDQLAQALQPWNDSRPRVMENGATRARHRTKRRASPYQPGADEVAAILYTSGTTGRPKGAVLTHRGLLDQPSRALLLPSWFRDSELVVALPVAHIMGLEALLSAAMAGVPTCFMPHFRPTEVLEAIERRRSVAFIGVPAMYRMLLDAGATSRDLRSIRLWISAADVMPGELARQFKKLGASLTIPGLNRSVGQAIFAEGYGMVELSGLVAGKLSPPFMPVGLGDAVAIPLPPFQLKVLNEAGQEVRAGEVGELAVKGPGTLRSYHGDSSATGATRTEDGWVFTGDLAKRQRWGLVTFVGRKKDVIKQGGYSVFPAEIEAVLRTHPAIADAAVVGAPDRVKGEVPVAFVELTAEVSLDPEALNAWMAERLSRYKCPSRLEILPELPRTATRKVAKNKLRELLQA